MIEFTGAQRKEVCIAIQSAFDRSALEQVVSFELNIDLETIVSGCNDSQITFRLVRWSEEQGCVVELLQAVCTERPANARLQAIAQQFLQSAQPRNRTDTPEHARQQFLFPEPCDFDLIDLMDSAVTHLDSKSGLVGLVIPCLEDTFQSYFCERLKKSIGRQNIDIRRPLSINPFIPISEIVAKIRKYENLLSVGSRDIVCPVPVAIFDEESEILLQFWKALSCELEDITLGNRLIVVLFCQKDIRIPPECCLLSVPVFKESDVRRWVVRIARLMQWEEEFWKDWKQYILDDCRYGDGPLDLRLIYEHLELSSKLLNCSLPVEEFMQELKSGF